jgi:hypothetical protein
MPRPAVSMQSGIIRTAVGPTTVIGVSDLTKIKPFLRLRRSPPGCNQLLRMRHDERYRRNRGSRIQTNDNVACASLAPLFWRLNPVKLTTRSAQLEAERGFARGQKHDGEARPEMFPIATAAVSEAFGPDVSPAVVFVPCEVTVIVPVKNVVAMEPNNEPISCSCEPYGEKHDRCRLLVPGNGVPSARVARMETVCCELDRLST